MPEQAARSAIELELSVPFQISQLSAALNAQAKKIIARHCDLNLAQWRILHLVCFGIADTTTTVRKATGIDKSQFSKSLSQLAEMRLVKLRLCKADKRQYTITATAAGNKLHARVAPYINARRVHLMASLSSNEQKILSHAIKRLEAAAQKTDFCENALQTGSGQ